MKSQVVRWVSSIGLGVALASVASAQSFSDGFEAYAAGSDITGQGGWAQWDNAAIADSIVSTLFAHSGSNSLATEVDADKVHEWTTYTSGQWRLGTWVYVPSTLIDPQWFVMLSDYSAGCAGAGTCFWVAQAELDPTVPQLFAQVGPSICTGANQFSLTSPLTFDTWHHIEVDVNFNTVPAEAQLYWDGTPLGDKFDYSVGLSGGGGPNSVDTIDLYANNNLTAFDRVYWDDVTVTSSTAGFTPCFGSVQVYCTAGTSSSGCVPQIGSVGTPSASAVAGFSINCSFTEINKQGLLFYGVSDTSFTPIAWGGTSSFLCVKAPTQRTAAQNSLGGPGACTGSYSTDWAAFMAATPGALGNPIAAGQSFDAQWWYRDPPSAKTTNLSNALRFVLAP